MLRGVKSGKNGEEGVKSGKASKSYQELVGSFDKSAPNGHASHFFLLSCFIPGAVPDLHRRRGLKRPPLGLNQRKD